MFDVVRHYLPLRRALLVLSETALLSASVLGVMAAHLVDPTPAERRALAVDGLSLADAFWRVSISSLIVALLAQIAIGFNDLYHLRVSSLRHARAARFLGSAGSAMLLALGALLLARAWRLEWVLDFPGMPLSQALVGLVLALALAFALLYAWRALFHFLLRRFGVGERVLVLGDGPAAQELLHEIAENPESGYEAIGVLSYFDGPVAATADAALAPSEPNGRTPPARPVRIERRGDLLETARAHRAGSIAVAVEDMRARLPMDELLACRMQGIAVEEAESLFERVSGKLAVRAMRPSYMVFNPGFRTNPMREAAKRALDVVLSLAILAVAWPAMLATALAVRLSSRGPIFYVQERVGRHGRTFTLLKFRSMVADAEARSGAVWAQKDDPRITPVGRFIRKTRLDELPQLFNVIGGNMAIVGPRPERPVFVGELAAKIPFYAQRHIVKPGLTGWAQINYPYGSSVEDARQKLQYDLFYIKNQSLLFDLSILFNTIRTVVLRKGT
jgi:sugar transferase (PEP-CTERM system associated)